MLHIIEEKYHKSKYTMPAVERPTMHSPNETKKQFASTTGNECQKNAVKLLVFRTKECISNAKEPLQEGRGPRSLRVRAGRARSRSPRTRTHAASTCDVVKLRNRRSNKASMSCVVDFIANSESISTKSRTSERNRYTSNSQRPERTLG